MQELVDSESRNKSEVRKPGFQELPKDDLTKQNLLHFVVNLYEVIQVYLVLLLYIYIYIYKLSKTSLFQVLKPFISDKIKLLKKLYFNVSGRCPFVKNKNYKIEDAPYIHNIT